MAIYHLHAQIARLAGRLWPALPTDRANASEMNATAKSTTIQWNQVEAAEKRVDAQLARELDIALPSGLGHEQQKALIDSFVRQEFVHRGMVADVAIHDGAKGQKDNPHAHVMLTMREIGVGGLGLKVRAWNDRSPAYSRISSTAIRRGGRHAVSSVLFERPWVTNVLQPRTVLHGTPAELYERHKREAVLPSEELRMPQRWLEHST